MFVFICVIIIYKNAVFFKLIDAKVSGLAFLKEIHKDWSPAFLDLSFGFKHTSKKTFFLINAPLYEFAQDILEYEGKNAQQKMKAKERLNNEKSNRLISLNWQKSKMVIFSIQYNSIYHINKFDKILGSVPNFVRKY